MIRRKQSRLPNQGDSFSSDFTTWRKLIFWTGMSLWIRLSFNQHFFEDSRNYLSQSKFCCYRKVIFIIFKNLILGLLCLIIYLSCLGRYSSTAEISSYWYSEWADWKYVIADFYHKMPNFNSMMSLSNVDLFGSRWNELKVPGQLSWGSYFLHKVLFLIDQALLKKNFYGSEPVTSGLGGTWAYL